MYARQIFYRCSMNITTLNVYVDGVLPIQMPSYLFLSNIPMQYFESAYNKMRIRILVRIKHHLDPCSCPGGKKVNRAYSSCSQWILAEMASSPKNVINNFAHHNDPDHPIF